MSEYNRKTPRFFYFRNLRIGNRIFGNKSMCFFSSSLELNRTILNRFGDKTKKWEKKGGKEKKENIDLQSS